MFEALDGAARGDVAIVGAGFSGLLTALHLAERGLDVLVIEAEDIEAGGSGQNHGQCIPVFGYLDPARLPPAGLELLCEAGRLVVDGIARWSIACKAVQNGTLSAAHADHAGARCRAAQAKYHALSKSDRWLDAEEVATLTGNTLYRGGWVHANGGHLNPLAYERGLARAALAAGIRIHTRSPMPTSPAAMGAGICELWRERSSLRVWA